MIYIENAVADILREAVRSGDITDVAEADIYTDDIASSEWKGVNKVYVLRGDSEPLSDMCADSGTSDILTSEVTISCLGADKESSLQLFEEVWEAFLNGIRNDESIDSVFFISSGDKLTLAEGDTLSVDSIIADGNIDGYGVIRSFQTAGNIAATVTILPLSPVLDWVETGFDAVPRFHNGSFQEQYFQVKTLKIYHTTPFH